MEKLTQMGLPILVCDHKGAIAAAWTVLDVKIPKQELQHAAFWHTNPPFTPSVAGVGAWIVLRGQGAGLYALQCMSTAIA